MARRTSATSSEKPARAKAPQESARADAAKRGPVAPKAPPATARGIGYRQAGVNIDEADRAVASIRAMARSTFTRAVLTDIGSFGGGYRLAGVRDPVLVSSADGVGTKLKLAFLTGRHSTVGEDLVNHCVNDIAVQGAAPLFFLDYFAAGKLDARVAAEVISGIARGCRCNGCALIGGETAEMPGFYTPGEYDLAGFIVGVVERRRMLTGAHIRPGDVLIGLPSTGLHTNGYSLARKLLFEVARHAPDTRLDELESTIADELLKLHRSYLKPLRALHDAEILKGAAHITGGGITDNTPRILPKGLGVRIDLGSWPVLPIFEVLRKIGRIPEQDWRRTFNLGIGMIFVVSPKKLAEAGRILDGLKEPWYPMGGVIRARGERVVYE
ncbi:MAG TPA: phosphoribosylformylglycinamidine cyclo-ligase [Bryobacteraceae bacterium]|nr:phosphoribosylformylglycinamidine cyclo-ligase [Bryobacteraceae bacterium]